MFCDMNKMVCIDKLDHPPLRWDFDLCKLQRRWWRDNTSIISKSLLWIRTCRSFLIGLVVNYFMTQLIGKKIDYINLTNITNREGCDLSKFSRLVEEIVPLFEVCSNYIFCLMVEINQWNESSSYDGDVRKIGVSFDKSLLPSLKKMT